MIKGKSVTRRRENGIDCRGEYRKIDALNKSSIACFDNDPVKFYNEFVLKKKVKKKAKGVSMVLGDLVDFYLLECGGDDEEFESRFDEMFTLFHGSKGTGQIFVLCDFLFEITQESMNSVGEVVTSFEDRFKEALEKAKEKKLYSGRSYEWALEDFDKNGKEYFQLLLDDSCKTVVEVSLVDKGRKIGNILLTDRFTRDIFLSKEGVEVYPKLPIEWEYLVGEKVVKCKSEVDLLRVDHNRGIIELFDLKTCFDNEEFLFSYTKFRYDLQAAFYYLAVEYWKRENNLDYEVVPMEFIVGDTSSNNRRPVRYQTTLIDLDAALNGCSIEGRRYKGIRELIDEISWAEDNNMWNASRELVENNGCMKLNIRYD